MSTGTKVPHARALASAERFKAFFPGCYHDWTFAGSLRRNKPEVGDIEHVVKPIIVHGRNLLWERMDELAPEGGGLFGSAHGPLERAVYGARSRDIELPPPPDADEREELDRNFGDGTAAAHLAMHAEETKRGSHRWGNKYRGAMFEGVKHEVFTADDQNWGCILAIRTGPADYSQMLVTELLKRGLFRQQDGYLKYQTGASKGAVRSVPTEEAFFELCGVKYVRPEDRR